MRPGLTFTAVLALCVVFFVAPAGAQQMLLVDLSQEDAPTQMLVASIQGVVNRDPAQAGVYVVRRPQDGIWLPLYRPQVEQVTPTELVDKVRDRLAGQVLYDPAEEHSINLAAAAAAILDAALTTRDLGLKTLLDVRGRWADRATAYRYAVAQMLAEMARDRLALIGPDRTDLRDYLAQERILAVDLDWRDQEQAALLREILARLQPGALVFGAPKLAADDQLLQLLAQRQDVLLPVSYAANLSFHSRHPATAALHQLDRIAPLAYEVMVTFVYEGGTDLGFALGPMRSLWLDPARGKVPLGWTISPALVELAPPVIQSYCADAWRSGNDELIMAPNGPGYFMPTGQADWTPLVERMAPWARAGDLRTAAVADPGANLERALPQYAKSGVRGILLGPGAKLTSGLYGSLAVVAQTVRATDAYQAIQAIRQAAETDKYVYVSVDPASLTPTDISYIAGRLGQRFMVLRPREFLEVAHQTTATGAQKPKQGSAEIGEVLLRPDAPGPDEAVEIRAQVRSPVKLASVHAVYTVSGAVGEWVAKLQPGPDSAYAGALPPVLEGGPVSVRIRAIDVEDGVTWTDPVSFEVKAPDGDADGLTDALERCLRTDPANPDTDADGWRDGSDAHPLAPDQVIASYLWPLVPPGDAAYIAEGGGTVAKGVRAVTGQEQVIYELPLTDAPRQSRPAFQAVVGGDYRLEASADGKQWQDIGDAAADVPLATGAWPIPAEFVTAGRIRIRVSDSTPDGGAPARVAALVVVADPEGPSILVAGTEPPIPAPGVPTRVLAAIFDPDGVGEASLHYRINQGGTIAVPMRQRGSAQVYVGEVHGALDGDTVTYWVSASDDKQNISATRPLSFHLGIAAGETISLLADRDCEGGWQLGSEWDGSRWNPRKGAADSATINITGGAYRVWVLAAPRGGGIEVAFDGQALGVTEASARDGWQSLGTVDLPRGKRQVTLTSTSTARCGYAQVLITEDRRAVPPPDMVNDFYNSLAFIAPPAGEAVSRRLVDVVATGTGNVAVVECLVDGASIGRDKNPPYSFQWNARHAAAGQHTIELRAFDRAGDLLLTTSLAVEMAK